MEQNRLDERPMDFLGTTNKNCQNLTLIILPAVSISVHSWRQFLYIAYSCLGLWEHAISRSLNVHILEVENVLDLQYITSIGDTWFVCHYNIILLFVSQKVCYCRFHNRDVNCSGT